MGGQLNIENFRSVQVLEPPTTTQSLPRHKQGEKFLRGPIPLSWLTVALRIPGRAGNVALAIWYLCGLNGNTNTIRLTGKTLREFGVKQKSGYRGLIALEAAGLILCVRKRGRCPIVTVLAAPASFNGNGKEGCMSGDKS